MSAPAEDDATLLLVSCVSEGLELSLELVGRVDWMADEPLLGAACDAASRTASNSRGVRGAEARPEVSCCCLIPISVMLPSSSTTPPSVKNGQSTGLAMLEQCYEWEEEEGDEKTSARQHQYLTSEARYSAPALSAVPGEEKLRGRMMVVEGWG